MKNLFKNLGTGLIFKALVAVFFGSLIFISMAPTSMALDKIFVIDTDDSNGKDTINLVDNTKPEDLIKDSTQPKPIAPDSNCASSTQTWAWRDYDGQAYKITYSICEKDYREAAMYREDLSPSTNFFQTGDIFTSIYGNLFRQSIPVTQKVVRLFEQLRSVYNLNDLQLAKAVVSAVQSIEYVLVHHLSCREICDLTRSRFINEYHDENRPCLPHAEKFGVISPTEFLFHKKADCDTRTVFLYSILKQLNYDVAILNNINHSILGINLPGISGSFKEEPWSGKKYYVWETTAEGFEPGFYIESGGGPFRPSEWDIVIK